MANDPRLDEQIYIDRLGRSEGFYGPRFRSVRNDQGLSLSTSLGAGGQFDDFLAQGGQLPAGRPAMFEAPPAAESGIGMGDYGLALGAGSGSAVGGLGTAMDVIGTLGARGVQRAANLVRGDDPALLNDWRMLEAARSGPIQSIGQGLERAGDVATQHYIGQMSEDAQRAVQTSLLEDPSWHGLGLKVAMSAPSMVAAGGPGMLAGRGAGALATKLGANEAKALAAGQVASRSAFVGTSAAIQGGSVAQDTYRRVMETPIEQIQATNPEMWAEALRVAGGNQQIAKEYLARKARDASFYAGAAISAVTNIGLGAGIGALGGTSARTLAGQAFGKEAGQEFLEEGGGRLAGGFAEQRYANRDADKWAPALEAGAEGYLVGRVMDVPANVGYAYRRYAGIPDAGQAPAIPSQNPGGAVNADPEADVDLLAGRRTPTNAVLEEVSRNPDTPVAHAIRYDEWARLPRDKRPPITQAGFDLNLVQLGRRDPAYARAREILDSAGPGSVLDMFSGGDLLFRQPNMPQAEAPAAGMPRDDRTIDMFDQMEQGDRRTAMSMAQPGQSPDMFGPDEWVGGGQTRFPPQAQAPQGALPSRDIRTPDMFALQEEQARTPRGETVDMFGGRQVMPTPPQVQAPQARDTQTRDMLAEQQYRDSLAWGEQAAAAARAPAGTTADMFGGRPSTPPPGGTGGTGGTGGPAFDMRLPRGNAVSTTESPGETGTVDWVAEQMGEDARSRREMTRQRMPEEDAANIDAIRALAANLRRRAAKAKNPDARERALNMADQLDAQADAARDAAIKKFAGEERPLGLPAPKSPKDLRADKRAIKDRIAEVRQSARLTKDYSGKVHRQSWYGKTAADFVEIIQSAKETGDTAAQKRAEEIRGYLTRLDNERAFERRRLENNLKKIREGEPKREPKPKAPRTLAKKVSEIDVVQEQEQAAAPAPAVEPEPAPAVEEAAPAPKAETKPKRPLRKPTPKAEAPAPKAEPAPAPKAEAAPAPRQLSRVERKAAREAQREERRRAAMTPEERAVEDYKAKVDKLLTDVDVAPTKRDAIRIVNQLERMGVIPPKAAAEARRISADKDMGVDDIADSLKNVEVDYTPKKTEAGGPVKYAPRDDGEGAPQSRSDVEGVVEKINGLIGLSPTIRNMVEVLERPSDLSAQIGEDVEPGASGAYVNGKVYLFASNLRSPHHAARVYLHELVGHAGLGRVFGQSIKSEMLRLGRENSLVKKMVDMARRQEGRENLPEDILIEEVISDIAATTVNGDFFKDNILGGLAKAIRSVFGNKVTGRWLDEGEVRWIVANSRRALRKEFGMPGPRAWWSIGESFSEMAKDTRVFQFDTVPRGEKRTPAGRLRDEVSFIDMWNEAQPVSGVNFELGTPDKRRGPAGFSAFADIEMEIEVPGEDGKPVKKMTKFPGYIVELKQVSKDDVYTYEAAIEPGPASAPRPPQLGAAVYQMLHAYARQRGLRLVGDDNTMSQINELRRTDAMMSAFLRAGGKTQFSTPGLWQFAGMLPDAVKQTLMRMRADLREEYELQNGPSYGLGFGSAALDGLRNRKADKSLTAKQEEQLKFLERVERELQKIRNRVWHNVPTGPYLSVADLEKVDRYDANNMAVLMEMFRSRILMDAPDADRLFVSPDGAVFVAPKSIGGEVSTSDLRQAGNLKDPTTVPKIMRALRIDPAESGIGAGTLTRFLVLNSMFTSIYEAKRGDTSGLGEYGSEWADPQALVALEREIRKATGRRILYSPGETSQEYRDMASSVWGGSRDLTIKMADKVGGWASDLVSDVKDTRITRSNRPGIMRWIVSTAAMHNPNLLARSNLEKIAKDAKLFVTEAGVDLFAKLDGHTRRKAAIVEQQTNSVHDVVNMFDGLSTETERELGKIMVDATIETIDPSLKFEEQAHLKGDLEAERKYKELVKRLDALGPEARKVFIATRNLFEAQRESSLKAMEALHKDDADTKRLIDHMRKGMKGPYFPLRRYGEYFVVAKQFKDGKEVDRVVTAYETEQEMLDAKQSMKRDPAFSPEKGWTVDARPRATDPDEQSSLPTEIRNQIRDSINRAVDSGQITKTGGNTLLASLEDIYIANLPGMPAAKAWLRRRGVKGASTDMKRATADAGYANAIRLADLQTSRDIAEAMETMRKHTVDMARKAETVEDSKRAVDATEIYKHLKMLDEAEAKDVLKGVRILSQLGPLWYLVTPSFWFMQPLQLFSMTLPKLAAKVPAGSSVAKEWMRSMSAINHAMFKEVYPAVMEQARAPWDSIKDRYETKDKSKALLSFKEKPFEDMLNSIGQKGGKPLTDAEKNMLRSLNERNLISVTMAFEVMNVAQQGSPTWQKVVKGAMWPAQNLELANRLGTGLAAYRLAVERDGLSHEAAIDYAIEVVTDTQVDYSEANRPHWLSSKFLGNFSPVAMFQMYRQNMLWNITHYGMKALKGDPEARRFFMGMMLTHGLLAGVKGLPIIGGIAWLVAALADAADDEDDPEYSPWEEMRAGLSDFVGPDVAEMLIFGAPRGAGLDTHGRLGLNGLYTSEYTKYGLGRDAMAGMIASATGVPGTMLMDLSEGLKLALEGEPYRAVRTVMPKGIKDSMKAGEYMTTGLTTRQGYVAVEPSLFNSLIQFIGFTPAEHANYYAAREVEKQVTDADRSLRKRLSDDAYEAIVDGDTQALAEVQQRAAEAGIKPKDLRRAIKAKQKEEVQYRGSKLGLTLRERERMREYLRALDTEKEEQ